jgi:hypothetical protein
MSKKNLKAAAFKAVGRTAVMFALLATVAPGFAATRPTPEAHVRSQSVHDRSPHVHEHAVQPHH